MTMGTVLNAKIQILRTTGAAIAAETPELGRVIYLTDEEAIVIGDGSTVGASLPRAGGALREIAGVIRQAVPDYNEDLVIGSPQLDDDGDASHDARLLFDKSIGAFRAGLAQGDEWDEGKRGFYSHAEGLNCQATASYAHAEGNGTVASASGTHVEGENTVAESPYSRASGKYAKANKLAQSAHASGRFVDTGDAQTSPLVLMIYVTHNSNAWYTLCLSNLTAQRVLVGSDRAVAFRCLIVGTAQGCAASWAYEITGLIENDGGTTAILGTPAVTTIYEADDADFEVQAVADDTNNALAIQVRDASGDYGAAVRWVGRLDLAEVGYPA